MTIIFGLFVVLVLGAAAFGAARWRAARARARRSSRYFSMSLGTGSTRPEARPTAPGVPGE